MRRYVALFIVFIFCLIATPVSSQVQLSDSAKISLLTASPWDGVVYAYYGHSAILVQDDSTGVDAVYNYGYFDDSDPTFLWYFVRGEMNYFLGVTPMSDFLLGYGSKGQRVVEQELNLTFEEKQELYSALYINSLPENRGQRYNYFFDNCATRPRDMIEKYTKGTIQYPATAKEQSFRDLLHECLVPYPWNKFGIDLVIGADADRIIDVREKMFIPAYLMNSMEEATVKNDTLSYPMIKNTKILLPGENQSIKSSELRIFTPLITAFALLFITIIVSILQIIQLNKTALPKVYDTLLFGITGIGGVIIFFLMFFSIHPATNPNWNFVWMNIFSLIAAILFWVKSARNIVYIYHFINFAVLIIFLLFWWFIPQKLPVATIIFSLSLLLRSGTNLWMLRKRKLKRKKFTSSSYMKAGWGQ